MDVFMMPPDHEELRRRLTERGRDTMEEVANRMQAAKEEIAQRDQFKYIMMNDEVEESAKMLLNLMKIEREVPFHKKTRPNNAVALLDMDGTITDLEGGLKMELERMRSPMEPDLIAFSRKSPVWLQARIDLIMSRAEWWEGLPELTLGFEILAELRRLDFQVMILTQGPRDKPHAWMAKARWCQAHVPDLPITMTRDKSLVYGRVLVDDYPGYVDAWLDSRPRGVVIMPANIGNKDYKRRGVLRYDGTNIKDVRTILEWARNRESGSGDEYPKELLES